MQRFINSFVTSATATQLRLKPQLQSKITIILCLLLLTGCGFKLRGAYQLPAVMHTTYVDSAKENSTLSRALIRSLKGSDIIIANSAAADIAVFKLFNERKSKRVVSVDGNGRAREYTLTYAVNFQVTAVDKKFAIESQLIKIDRDFVFDTEDVLGNSREESKLYEEMQQDIIRLILLRLQSKV